MNKAYIIGVGPGAKEYLPEIALEKIMQADTLIGAQRNLAEFESLGKETIVIKGNFDEMISYIKANRAGKKIALLVSGDSGIYSLLGLINRCLKKNEYEVVPGISSMQLAFARIAESWHDALILSLHGRRINDLAEKVVGASKVFLFTDSALPPERIAAHLLAKGVKDKKAIVFENLSYPSERIVEASLEELSEMSGFGLCVVIIKDL